MTPSEIIQEIKSMKGYSVLFYEDGLISSQYGRSTINYWRVIDGKLKCVHCKTLS